jgi:hypothetical protein
MSVANTTMPASCIGGEGRYRFRTILPALYPGRTRHYHIKVQAPERPVLTTQLYFPDEPANRRDGLFRPELAMRITEAPDGPRSAFRFCARHAVFEAGFIDHTFANRIGRGALAL